MQTNADSLSDHGPGSALVAAPIELVADDGFLLGARLFTPQGAARGTVVIHGATAVPQTYYAPFAAHLARRGMRVLTYDYRGVGASRPASLRSLDATMTDWAERDARAAQAHASAIDARVAIVGHSFGGQILGLVDELREARGAVLVGVQLGFYGHWPHAIDRARLSFLWNGVVPALTGIFGYLPGAAGLGTDLPAGVAREWARWCSDERYLFSDHPSARERFARFDRPTVAYTFTDDDFAPERAVRHLLDQMPSERVAHVRLSPRELELGPIGHFGFFRRRFREALWGGAGDFLLDVLEGRSPETPRPRSPFAPSLEDVMADLRAGREA
jgi:predicted alpha/beta hydrolase